MPLIYFTLFSSMAPGILTVKNNRKIAHWNFETGYDDNEGDKEYPVKSIFSQSQFFFFLVISKRKSFNLSNILQFRFVWLTQVGQPHLTCLCTWTKRISSIVAEAMTKDIVSYLLHRVKR